MPAYGSRPSAGQGGVVEDLTYENLTMTNVKVAILITSYYPRNSGKSPQDDPARSRSARPRRSGGISALPTSPPSAGKQAGRIVGLPEMPIENIVLDHVNLSAQMGLQVVHARGIRFIDSHVTAADGPVLSSFDADISGLDAQSP
jgi:polygalacturonase